VYQSFIDLMLEQKRATGLPPVPASFRVSAMNAFLQRVLLVALPAIAMGFVDSPEKALFVTIAYIGIQFIENHLLIPILMKEGIDLPPALTIVAQSLMAIVFGVLGLLVAVPLLATVMIGARMATSDKNSL